MTDDASNTIHESTHSMDRVSHPMSESTHSMDRVSHPIAHDEEHFDIEMGTATSAINEAMGENFGDGEYTHILIPRPSYSVESVRELQRVHELQRCAIAHSLVLHNSSKAKKKHGEDNKVEIDEDVNTTMEETKEQEEITLICRQRPAPIFCAICRTEYRGSDRVCWSSNEGCILQVRA